MSREEESQLCALLAKLRFEIARIALNQPNVKEFDDEVEMINKIMSICILPENIKMKRGM